MCDIIVVVPVFRNKRIQNFNSSNKAELHKNVSSDALRPKWETQQAEACLSLQLLSLSLSFPLCVMQNWKRRLKPPKWETQQAEACLATCVCGDRRVRESFSPTSMFIEFKFRLLKFWLNDTFGAPDYGHLIQRHVISIQVPNPGGSHLIENRNSGLLNVDSPYYLII